MAKENDDSYLDDTGSSNGKWTELKLGSAPQETEDETDVNADLYDDSVPAQVAKKVVKATKTVVQEEVEEEDNGDDTSYLDDEPEDEEEVTTEVTEETPEEETPEEEVKETVATPEDTDKPKNKVQKRFERLIEKLKSETAEKQQLEIEASIREAQYIQAIQELQAQLAATTNTAVTTKVKEAESAVETARRKLKAAKMNADEDAEMEALEELADAKARQREAAELAAKAPKPAEGEAANRVPVDVNQVIARRKNQAWVDANQKYLSNPLVARVVTTVDAQLQQEGFNPVDDEYRVELSKRTNKALKSRNINVTLVSANTDFDYESLFKEEEPETVTAPIKKKPLNPMSKGEPSGGVKKNRTVARLDDSGKALAAKFGIPAEIMLRQRALASKNKDTKNIPVYIPTNTGKKK